MNTPTDGARLERAPAARPAPAAGPGPSPTPGSAAPQTGGPVRGGAAPRVIGLDLSITETGIADVSGALTTAGGPAAHGDTRLLAIRDSVHLAVLDGVDLVVIEDLPTHAKGAGITGMVHGIIRAQLITFGIRYALVTPASLKKYASGNGNANKADMRVALLKRADLDERNDNKVDAWWLRAMGLDHLGHPPVTVPKTHRDALTKVTWPEATR